MKRLITFLLILISLTAFSQEIKKGTAFIIEFVDIHNNMNFEIVSEKTFDNIIDFSKKSDSIFEYQPKKNQIVGFFANEKAEERVVPTLILVSGIAGHVDYELEIKRKQDKFFLKTSTLPLAENLKSVEIWTYPIKAIKFKKFNLRSIEELEFNEFQFKVEIDSTCINTPTRNIERGEKEFKSHLKSVIKKFENVNEFKLKEMLSYEKSINSEDKSLGHFWSLGNGIYPNKKDFKFGDPLSYRRVECPYFENRVNYFYTKKLNDIKMVSFNWEVFKESNMGVNDEISDNIGEKFKEKFEFIFNTVTRFLNTPIENITDPDGQRHVRWKNAQGLNAYLFNFSNYAEIRLYIYKE
ncbi:MAG: hypothetical protein BM557_06845 [Flavobacterium sp. MedPE-SWcel]|uniref:hypothetical protein n=1 Tax=uncultured Flavobacterium sp. TaxID=165435 RepID=UPI0009217F3C|nr:hypothetical protein [uncultured Flavobacterium sp.]OIQ18636.1 MAG: hypothetical protein BM557_06845 [Flavobacterium sp. MedPE-SWcel]